MSKKKYSPKELGYELIWEDNFNGNRLDTAKWKVRDIGKRSPEKEGKTGRRGETGKGKDAIQPK